MKRTIDFYSYIFKYTYAIKYKEKKWTLIFPLINLILFSIAAHANVIKIINFNLPFSAKAIGQYLLSYSIGLMLITLLNLISTIRPIYLKWKKNRDELKHAKLCPKIDLNGVQPNKNWQIEEYSYRVDGTLSTEKIYYSPSLNTYLANATSKIEIIFSKSKATHIEAFITANFEKLSLFLKLNYNKSRTDHKDFFNEPKLCLSQDIEINKPVKCHKGSYFDTLLTNGVAGRYIQDAQGNILADFVSTFPIKYVAGNKYIKNITETNLNNHMGASTIAFTSDNYLVFWIQNNRALFSNDLIAPTGSGSCDQTDLIDMDLIKTVTQTMNRELLEESTKKIDFSQIEQTKVIGFFRWLSRAGLPQFVGITKLKVSYTELAFNAAEVRTPNAHESEIALQQQINDMSELTTYLTAELKKENLSVPLYYNIFSLLRYIENSETEAEKFFFGN